MADLFVANAQHQAHQFFWRLPEQDERTPPYQMMIQAGGQVKIPGDLRPPDIEAIIKQHVKYGLGKAGDKMPADRRVPLLYSDKPIRVPVIEAAVLHNRTRMRIEGETWRNRTAVAINSKIRDNIFEMQLPDQLRQLDITIQEDAKPGADGVGEGISVTENAEEQARGGFRRRNARRAR